MIDRVVLAFDGSELSREAFSYSLMLAEVDDRPRSLGVHAVHVLEPDPPPMIAGDPGLVDPTPIIRQREADREKETEWARREFAEMAGRCEQRGVAFSQQIETGPLLDTLCDIASAHDLIAVGRKGRFKRSGLGSTTAALLKHAPGPVLVVSGEMRPVNRVLAVSDGSSVSKRAVAEAEEFAEASGWPLYLLAAAGRDHDPDEAIARARELAPKAEIVGVSEREQRDEAKLIEQAASADHYALLFMGAYPESLFHRLLFGGATERVLSNLGAPVVLVR